MQATSTTIDTNKIEEIIREYIIIENKKEKIFSFYFSLFFLSS